MAGDLKAEGIKMKTARFVDVVEAAGRPDVHVLLTRPEDDSALQAAIRSHHVMTVHQNRIRGKADHGAVGFDPGQSRQFLIFPRSISQFAGRSIVAIKYDLLKGGDAQAQAKSSKTANSRRKSRPKAKPPKAPTRKIIPFVKPLAPENLDLNDEELRDLGQPLRRAIELLKQGKQDAAVRLLSKLSTNLRPPRPESSKS
jgi:hypothetical protein